MRLFRSKTASTMALILATTLGLSLAAPQKAEAGLVLIGLSATAHLWAGEDTFPAQVTLGVAGGGMIVGSMLLLTIPGIPLASDAVILGLFFLDADGSVSQDKLAQGFKKAFPSIDNSEVLKDLASAVKEKFIQLSAQIDPNQGIMVSLTEDETRQILAPAFLTESQIQEVVQALR